MRSAGNGDVVQSRLQVLPIHVFLVAPLGACHMAQPRADQHQERHLKPHEIRPHLRRLPPKQLHSHTLRPSCGAGRCRPRRRTDSARLIQLYNFLGHSLLSPFRMVCRDFILPEPASYVFFYAIFNLRKLLYISMMSQPGQKPRGGGIYRSPFHYTPKDVACKYCQNYDRKHSCRLYECTCLEERIEAGVLELNEFVRDCFALSMGPQLRKRMHQQFRERKP